jgi:hypothetical protein
MMQINHLKMAENHTSGLSCISNVIQEMSDGQNNVTCVTKDGV